ncbi:MAG TPA: hypothetical protein VGC22_03845 [Chitinophaga sp.]
MMSKQHLTDKIKLIYTGKHFEGFCKETPYMTFLGYDCSGWSTIWVDYLGKIMFVMLHDVELAGQL